MPWATRASDGGFLAPPALPFLDPDELGGRPNVVVDGSPTEGTVLTLSHWPGSPTPEHLRRDLSAEIAFAYLDDRASWVQAEAVTNNHLDEDGVAGVFALADPVTALAHRDRLVEVARCGDFGWTVDRTAARLAFAIGAQTALGYPGLLAALPGWLDDPDRAREWWAAADRELERDLARVESGAVHIHHDADLDLTVVAVDDPPSPHTAAVYPHAPGSTQLWRVGDEIRIEQRYEGWVRFVSRPVQPRRDLRPLAEELAAIDDVPWHADPPSSIVPGCAPAGRSSLELGEVRDRLAAALASGAPAWDPSG